jgi:S1-C subfamily serine protease
VSPRAQSPVPRQGQIAKGGSTIGVSVYGTQIDYVVPGGPAHLSQKLEKGDEILSVDSVNVDFGNVVQCLQGNDTIGSRVKLRVRKSATGQEVQVDLVRVDKGSMENLVKIFQKLTLLKQNGHNNEGFESRCVE